jgi:predicted PurR-regulated permease PerM
VTIHANGADLSGSIDPSRIPGDAACGDYGPTRLPSAAAIATDPSLSLPRRGLLERDWQTVLVVLLTMLAGLALSWVLWQVLSPISHTLILFGLAAVLAFALSGPVNMLSTRTGNRLVAIVAVYLLVGFAVVGGLTLLAGPFVRDATALSGALPRYAADVQARAPEVQSTLGQYGYRPTSRQSRPALSLLSSRVVPTSSRIWLAP